MSTLNVKDALEYLDQVKIQFSESPDVYNRFLDIMKDFKSQAIDTPGVIDRVSELFRGHPGLIQGFNTFLPPGYRIDCSVDHLDNSFITVTTPTGTTTRQTNGGDHPPLPVMPPEGMGPVVGSSVMHPSAPAPPHLPPPPGPRMHEGPSPVVEHPISMRAGLPVTAPELAPEHRYAPPPMRGPYPPPAHQGMMAPGVPTAPDSAREAIPEQRPPVEFNHAINYVNKIKQRFSHDPETYKKFLEILQTYQRESRAIQEVYAEVTLLFDQDADLLDEFKQFLPDTGAQPAGLFGALSGGASEHPPSTMEAAKPKRRAPSSSALPPAAAGTKRARHKHKPPEGEFVPETEAHMVPSGAAIVPGLPPPGVPPTMEILSETDFFQRLKEHLGDVSMYYDFLKLLTLFAKGTIDLRMLVDRAALFLGDNRDLMTIFKALTGYADLKPSFWDAPEPVIENVPAAEAARPDLSVTDPPAGQVEAATDRVLSTSGGDEEAVESLRHVEAERQDIAEAEEDVHQNGEYSSYRRLPPREVNAACSGRDETCWEVLNDEWVTHPVRASHGDLLQPRSKTVYEQALTSTEEERHEFDYYIEATLRTIALLEPLAQSNVHMTPAQRESWRLRPGLGGNSKTVYQSVLKKVYGPELGPVLIDALHESPGLTIPLVLHRLRQKDEEWKRAQREWNKVWREVDARAAPRARDVQVSAFRTAERKSLSAQALVDDLAKRKAHQEHERLKMDPILPRLRGDVQLVATMDDVSVLADAVKLILVYIDRAITISARQAEQIEHFLRTFLPHLLLIPPDEWDEVMEPPGWDEESQSETSVDEEERPVVRRGRQGKSQADLRKTLLKKTHVDQVQVELSVAAPDGVENSEASTSEAPADEDMDEDPREDEGVHPVNNSAAEDPTHPGTQLCFADTDIYYVVRLVQILYARLAKFKRIAAVMAREEAAEGQSKVAIWAEEVLGATAAGQGTPNEEPARGPPLARGKSYAALLYATENFLDGALERQAYLEAARFLFKDDGYLVSTLDSLVAAAAQAAWRASTDEGPQALLRLFGEAVSKTSLPEGSYAAQAVRVFEEYRTKPDAPLIRLQVNGQRHRLAVSLVTPAEVREWDSEVTQRRAVAGESVSASEAAWLSYMKRYAALEPTGGDAARARPPFLARSLRQAQASGSSQGPTRETDQLDVRVSLHSYRLCFYGGSERFFQRVRPHAASSAVERTSSQRVAAFERLLAAKLSSPAPDPVPEPVPETVTEPDEPAPASIASS